MSGSINNDMAEKVSLSSSSISGSFAWYGSTNEISGLFIEEDQEDKWQEAALYMQEGENDAKFYQHPTNKWSKKIYGVLHHRLYYFLHFVVSILLMLLVFAEEPAVGESSLNHSKRKLLTTVHTVLELVLLSFLGVDIFLKAIWYGYHRFLQQRTVIIALVFFLRYAEVLVFLCSHHTHVVIRLTRVFRPIFLIDTHYMIGVRRTLRQMLRSLVSILDVILIWLFFISIYSFLGYELFADSDPEYFSSYSKSFLSLFITQTTANHPDVMMESYAVKPATPIFFIVYIIVVYYITSNVLLAVVHRSFTDADRKKLRKIFFHKRHALSLAYKQLVPAREDATLDFSDFFKVVHHYRPTIPEWQIMCIFKALHCSPEEQNTGLSLDEFYHFYEVIDFEWNEVTVDGEAAAEEDVNQMFTRVQKALKRLVTHRVYKFIISVIIVANTLFLLIYTEKITDESQRFSELHRVLPVSFAFIAIYMLDICLSIIGHGFKNYFRKFVNIADFFMILISFICLCCEINHRYIYLSSMRPLKLFRLIWLKQRYRMLVNTLVDLLPRLLNISILILLIYYIFAIIGLEFFSFKVGQGCCNTSWYEVEDYYTGPVDNSTRTSNLYYLNNFDNILKSYATLFILMVVNNWYIIMEGIASSVSENYHWLARVYFMTFYIIITVVLQVAISFTLDAFMLKYKVRQITCKVHPEDNDCICKETHKKEVTLTKEDIVEFSVVTDEEESSKKLKSIKKKLDDHESIKFVGHRKHTKEDIQMLMFENEIPTWIEQYKKEPRRKKPTVTEMALKICRGVVDYILD